MDYILNSEEKEEIPMWLYEHRVRFAQSKKVNKSIIFPEILHKALVIRARKFGMKYTEYLRYLIARDVHTEIDQLNTYYNYGQEGFLKWRRLRNSKYSDIKVDDYRDRKIF